MLRCGRVLLGNFDDFVIFFNFFKKDGWLHSVNEFGPPVDFLKSLVRYQLPTLTLFSFCLTNCFNLFLRYQLHCSLS